MGQCSDCGKWNTLVEEAVLMPVKGQGKSRSFTEFSSEISLLSDESAAENARRPTGIGEFDRLLAGGLVPGQVVLLAGPPGIGKSTIMLQAAAGMAGAADAGKILYVSGEESPEQVRSRAGRLGIKSGNIYLVSETNLAKIIEAFNKIKPSVVVLDSIQTVFHPEYYGSPGSVGQVRECSSELLRVCKSAGAIAFILGHVTKEGSLAGPKVLEHIVDTVLYFDTEKNNVLRILRAYKNRFGSTSEVGIFEMGEKGLSGVDDAGAFFAGVDRDKPAAGRAFSIVMEGTRPLLAELQALVSPTRYPFPRRMATGVDLNRMQIMIAALEKHVKLRLENADVFVNIAGGIKFKDPAMDLALCAAVISSAREAALPADAVFIGEAGILGQAARTAWMAQRLKEAERLGFKKAFAPALPSKEMPRLKSLKIIEVNDLECLSAFIRDGKREMEDGRR